MTFTHSRILQVVKALLRKLKNDNYRQHICDGNGYNLLNPVKVSRKKPFLVQHCSNMAS